MDEQIKRAAAALREADALLVSAGAGMMLHSLRRYQPMMWHVRHFDWDDWVWPAAMIRVRLARLGQGGLPPSSR